MQIIANFFKAELAELKLRKFATLLLAVSERVGPYCVGANIAVGD